MCIRDSYSAISNAENNHNLDIDNLIVAEAFVGKNLIMKRFAARGRGRGSTIIKPFSQLTVVVRQVEQEKIEKKAAKKPANKPAAKAPAKKSKEAK